MAELLAPRHGWGPDSKKSALSVTFDNFGEAAEIEVGWWGDKPVGEHFTAAFVPRLIEALGHHRATYFVEASNALIYPDALRTWVNAGHEIGVHAWRHEVWEQCAPERRRELLAKSLAAFRDIGVEPIGFRPPGGGISMPAWLELEAAGLLYCSAVDEPGAARVGGMISLPFRWIDVDAYMLEDLMESARVRDGLCADPVAVSEWRGLLGASLKSARETGGHRSLVFHPQFLASSPEKLAVVSEILAEADKADMWVAPAAEIARFLAQETNSLGGEVAQRN